MPARARMHGRSARPLGWQLVAVKLLYLQTEVSLAPAPGVALAKRTVSDLAKRAVFAARGLHDDVQQHRAQPAIGVEHQDDLSGWPA